MKPLPPLPKNRPTKIKISGNRAVADHLERRIAFLRKELEEIASPHPYPNKREIAILALEKDRAVADQVGTSADEIKVEIE